MRGSTRWRTCKNLGHHSILKCPDLSVGLIESLQGCDKSFLSRLSTMYSVQKFSLRRMPDILLISHPLKGSFIERWPWFSYFSKGDTFGGCLKHECNKLMNSPNEERSCQTRSYKGSRRRVAHRHNQSITANWLGKLLRSAICLIHPENRFPGT